MPRTFLKKGAFILIACLVIGYAIFQSQNLIQGAKLVVASPSDNTTVTESLLAVKGTALRVSRISLEGRPIFTDKEGVFSEQVLLAPGPNELYFEFEDRFGRKGSKRLLVFYNAPEGTSPLQAQSATTTSLGTAASSSAAEATDSTDTLNSL